MCTGKRQTHIRNVPSSRTVVTGIAPYEAFSKNVRNSEMLQVSREKSRKTEGAFYPFGFGVSSMVLQAARTFAAMGAAVWLPEPPRSAKTTKASG